MPMLFMGQEFLEDKLWSDSPGRADRLIWWAGALGADRHMADFLRFTRDLIALRRSLPALRAEPIAVHPADEDNRVLAFQRWVPGAGRDVVVVVEPERVDAARLPARLPAAGPVARGLQQRLLRPCPNPWVAGNDGSVVADGPGLHGWASRPR